MAKKNCVEQKKILMKYYSLSLILSIILFLLCMVFDRLHIQIEGIFFIVSVITFIFLSTISSVMYIKLITLDNQHKKQLSVFRHDIRGLLSPALLMVDRILLNQTIDEKTKQSTNTIADSIEAITRYLNNSER